MFKMNVYHIRPNTIDEEEVPLLEMLLDIKSFQSASQQRKRSTWDSRSIRKRCTVCLTIDHNGETMLMQLLPFTVRFSSQHIPHSVACFDWLGFIYQYPHCVVFAG